jgi:AcrR family transcriptional regulator
MTDDWRARKKAATKHAIQQHALRLFTEKSYDATTVEEIAAAAGVSHMTFFRYFPRKEDVVEYDDYDPLIEELIVARPADEPPLVAIHAALRAGLGQIVATDRDALLTRVRLILRNPLLRARNLIAQEETRDMLARALARRMGLSEPDFAATAQASAALGAMAPAVMAWADGVDEDYVALVDAAFAALQAGLSR